jgi:EmrB/QacA subfamily drug resistance transporter
MSFEKKITFLSAFTLFISLLDVNIVFVAYPSIAQYFHIDIANITKVSIYFLLTLTITMPIAGKLNDLFGEKIIFSMGYIIFIFSALLCCISISIDMLAISRGIQGIGASMLSISSTTIIVNNINPKSRGASFGILATAGSLGLILGAPLGGLLTGYFGWQSIFLIAIPLSLTSLYYGHKILPTQNIKRNNFLKSFDFKGALLISLGLGFTVFSINLYIKKHSFDLTDIVILIMGIIFSLILYNYEKSIKNPLIDFSVFNNKTFKYILITNMLSTIVLSINLFIIPFHLSSNLNISPEKTGIIMLAFSFMYGFFSPIAGKFSDKSKPLILCITGIFILLTSISIFLLNLANPNSIKVLIYLTSIGIGFAFFIPTANKLAMQSATKNNAGNITAIFRTSRQFASLLGVALVGIITSKSFNLTKFILIFKIEFIIILTAAITLLYLKRIENE